MNNVVEQIQYDHISISRILLLLEQELVKLKTDVSVDYYFMLECMRYMIEYAEVVHHPKEDVMMDCVYNKSEELDPVIDEIKFQHQSMGATSGAFNESLKAVIAEQFVEKEAIVSQGLEFVRLQRNHIRLEEESLLRKLKKLLTPEDIEAINKRYEGVIDPQLSDDFEEQFGRLYQSLLGA